MHCSYHAADELRVEFEREENEGVKVVEGEVMEEREVTHHRWEIWRLRWYNNTIRTGVVVGGVINR